MKKNIYKKVITQYYTLLQPKQQDIYSLIAKHHGEEFPKCVKAFLKYAAMTSMSSLANLSNQTISDIETCINDADQEMVKNLVEKECCHEQTYRAQTKFKFLPGHKCFLLLIPSIIEKIKVGKEESNKRLSEFKKIQTPAELKNLLLKKLNQNLMKSNADSVVFNESHVTELKTIISNNALTAKCVISCVQCSATCVVSYNGSWTTSNILRHVKAHLLSKHRQFSTTKQR